ncbi:MAG: hypothetical protein AVDCRST_MAG79-442, partial [uncultured Thermoleophilia bacterium]
AASATCLRPPREPRWRDRIAPPARRRSAPRRRAGGRARRRGGDV